MEINKYTRDNLIISGLVFVIVLLIFVAYSINTTNFEGRFQAQITPGAEQIRKDIKITSPANGFRLGGNEETEVVVSTRETHSIIFIQILELTGPRNQICTNTKKCIFTLNTTDLPEGINQVIAVSVDKKGGVHSDKINLEK